MYNLESELEVVLSRVKEARLRVGAGLAGNGGQERFDEGGSRGGAASSNTLSTRHLQHMQLHNGNSRGGRASAGNLEDDTGSLSGSLYEGERAPPPRLEELSGSGGVAEDDSRQGSSDLSSRSNSRSNIRDVVSRSDSRVTDEGRDAASPRGLLACDLGTAAAQVVPSLCFLTRRCPLRKLSLLGMRVPLNDRARWAREIEQTDAQSVASLTSEAGYTYTNSEYANSEYARDGASRNEAEPEPVGGFLGARRLHARLLPATAPRGAAGAEQQATGAGCGGRGDGHAARQCGSDGGGVVFPWWTGRFLPRAHGAHQRASDCGGAGDSARVGTPRALPVGRERAVRRVVVYVRDVRGLALHQRLPAAVVRAWQRGRRRQRRPR